jgi:hypothetical protein
VGGISGKQARKHMFELRFPSSSPQRTSAEAKFSLFATHDGLYRNDILGHDVKPSPRSQQKGGAYQHSTDREQASGKYPVCTVQ